MAGKSIALLLGASILGGMAPAVPGVMAGGGGHGA